MMKPRPALAFAVRHPVATTLMAIAGISGVSVAVVIAALEASGIGVFPLAIVLSVAMPVMIVPLIVYPLLAANRRQGELHAELERLARTDMLTDLPNRRAFFEFANELPGQQAAADRPLTAMMIDVDYFKRINDEFGHDYGDAVLKRVAGVIANEVAAVKANTWIVARLGGEEFAVIVDGLAPSAVARLADRICAQVHRQVGAGDRLDPVTVSIGVAFRRPGMKIDRLLKAADDAVYAAKRAGRDRWAFATNDAHPAGAADASEEVPAGRIGLK